MTTIEHIAPIAVSVNEEMEISVNGQNAAALKERRKENERVREIVAELNRLMGSSNTRLSFTIDRSLKKTIVKVVDAETNKVIRQIPSEDALKVAQHVQSMMGILYDVTG